MGVHFQCPYSVVPRRTFLAQKQPPTATALFHATKEQTTLPNNSNPSFVDYHTSVERMEYTNRFNFITINI